MNADRNETPLVSILIPCYNAEQWIEQCILSALEQDYPNKEVIVVDDGSTDGSRRVIESFGGRILFYQGAHAGANAARNQLTRLARGEWLQYLDADDYLLPRKLSSQVQASLQRGGVDGVYSPVVYHNVHDPSADYTLEMDEDAALTYIRWGPLQTTGLLLRREAVLAAGGWKEDQPCCQEHELLLRLLQAGYRFALAKEVGAVYRFHGEGTVSRRDPLRVVRIRMDLTDRAVQYFESSGRFSAAHKKALFVARMESARSVGAQDPAMADQLSRNAFQHGAWWFTSSPALRFHYMLALRLLGFRRAEAMGTWLRRKFGRSRKG